jgi:hypothetical protein
MFDHYRCAHCKGAVSGPAHIHLEHIYHPECVAPSNRAARGLVHPCPQCKESGRVKVETGRTVEEWVSLSRGETPGCAYNGCYGCYACQNGVKRVRVKETREDQCPLCEGEGWLTAPPEPIQQVVGWKKGK